MTKIIQIPRSSFLAYKQLMNFMEILQDDQELAKVQFLKWTDLYLTEKPFQMFLEIPSEVEDQRKTNLVFEHKDVVIKNIRGREDNFQLDKHGFIVRKFSKGAELPAGQKLDVQTVESFYFPAIEELLRKEVDGVDRIFLLDWRASEALL